MTPEEARAASALAGRAFAGATGVVGHTHLAATSWTLERLGLGRSARAHRVLAGGVYSAIRTAGPLAARATGHAAAAGIDPDAQPVSATPRGSRLQAALNGAVGDHLASVSSALAVSMSVRHDGHDIPCDAPSLAAAFPDASSHVVVFVHGLCHEESSWTPPAEPDAARSSYVDGLARDTDATPVLLRYNTGRHVSQNGADLSSLLTALCDAWPVPLTDLVLVGHSMGGLVIRSACAEATRDRAAWPARTRLIVTLGTPHTGAPLERAAAAAARVLERAEGTRGIARVFHSRSSGIKDLRHGLTSPTEWADCDQDACGDDHRLPTSHLESAEHLVVAATVTPDPAHPLGRIVGDLMVPPASALGWSGDGRHVPFPDGSERLVGGVTHLGLMRDAAVYEQILSRLIDRDGLAHTGRGRKGRQ